MKKKTFVRPEIKVVELMSTDIICTSNQTDAFILDDGMKYNTQDW